MKRPSNVKVGTINYDVNWDHVARKREEEKHFDDKTMAGFIIEENHTIHVDGDMADAQQKLTFIHELVHSIEHNMGHELGEQAVNALSFGFLGFLRDNLDVVTWLQESLVAVEDTRHPSVWSESGGERPWGEGKPGQEVVLDGRTFTWDEMLKEWVLPPEGPSLAGHREGDDCLGLDVARRQGTHYMGDSCPATTSQGPGHQDIERDYGVVGADGQYAC